ncbi:uncharacterized protein LOC115455920 isoform X4 [Manduca sexta]|uniref:Uncharacterized protein n=1 Tax=Manduca sexta TaxID=7130 RepID=A0A921YR73_MANSE|nr:uncharacterized protein LOC115455920 isoform X4 [Manduca sexta]KAG6443439.1 hypothetical protein O3G_MSEX002854 [Manduca sexta]
MPPSAEDLDMRSEESNVSITAIAYISVLCTLLLMSFVIMCIKMAHLGQKTRNPQQRRMYMGTRARPSLGPSEPTIYVSPSNLPPPPKYECMAPPSYEEVVGVHYPNYQVQPITQPIAAAMAQSSSNETANRNEQTATRNTEAPETVITVATEPTRTSVTVARS